MCIRDRHYTSTSNGECQTLLGLYPKNGNPITMKRKIGRAHV